MNVDFELLNGKFLALRLNDRVRIDDAPLAHEGSLLKFFDISVCGERTAAIKWPAEVANEYLAAARTKAGVAAKRAALIDALGAAREAAKDATAPYFHSRLDSLRREAEGDDGWRSHNEAAELRRRFNPYSA